MITKTPHYNVDKMYTYLRGFLVGAGLTQSLTALAYAREKHKDQKRKNGIPYIVHPLSMACYAIALGLKDDNVISSILLHDVAEDCGVAVENLPVNDVVKFAVKRLTITPIGNESSLETKRRYFAELLDSKEAIITKALDRYNNLTDMPFALKKENVAKNAAETDMLLLPVLKQAKEKWSDLSDFLFVIRDNLRAVNDIAKLCCEEEYEKWIKEYEEIKL